MTGGRVWRLDFPWTTPPLSMNPRQHGHWAVRSRVVRDVRSLTKAKAQQAGLPRLERVAVELHYAPRDKRRRDSLNLVATLKPIEDGLVDAGVVPDDTEEFVVPTMPILDDPTGTVGRLYVIVREVLR